MWNIGILGYGTIGKGVKTLVDEISIKYNCQVVKILDKKENKDLIGSLYVSNYLDITTDENINIVVEALGGNDFAYECIKSALSNHKHVVTSNKEVVSRNLKEFNELALKNNVKFLFEASVGGGIPILYNLAEIAKFNQVNNIKGIINGTTNYILSNMEDGLSFEEALKKAQERGFAEKDPTADLEGLDMVRKISILSDLAFDTFINPSDVYHYGIKKVTKDMLDYLKSHHYHLKFMASANLINNNLQIMVMPRVVKENSIYASIRYENNIISFKGLRNDELSFIGKGAGRFPTASAIISDIIKIIEGCIKINNTYNNLYHIDKKIIKEDKVNFVVSNNGYEFINGSKVKDLNDYDFIAVVEDK